MKRILQALLLSLFLASPALADEGLPLPKEQFTAPLSVEPGETAFEFKLSGYVFGFKIMNAKFRGHYGTRRYWTYTDLKTSGLAAMLKKERIWSTTQGRIRSTGLYPARHVQQNLNKKARRVAMLYDRDNGSVNVKVRPPHGSQGTPPATEAQKFKSSDVNTALLTMMLRGYAIEGEICNETLNVFDSKQHYQLRMAHQGTKSYKYDGTKYPAVVCHIYYEPISGFDPEDLPDSEEGSTPVIVYFVERPEYGMYLPVKFTYKISGFKATIKIKDVQILSGTIK